jgi:hypothetical protein
MVRFFIESFYNYHANGLLLFNRPGHDIYIWYSLVPGKNANTMTYHIATIEFAGTEVPVPGKTEVPQPPPQQPLPTPQPDMPVVPEKPEIKQVPEKPEVTPVPEPFPTTR